MPHFTDTAGHRWNLALSVGTVKRVRELSGVDLLTILDKPQALVDLASDPVRFVDVLFIVIKPQADQIGICDEAFGESLDGETVEAATDAFLEALVDFFPGARKTTLKRVLDRAKGTARLAEGALQKALDDGTIDQAISEALAGVGTLSSNSPAASESTPTD